MTRVDPGRVYPGTIIERLPDHSVDSWEYVAWTLGVQKEIVYAYVNTNQRMPKNRLEIEMWANGPVTGLAQHMANERQRGDLVAWYAAAKARQTSGPTSVWGDLPPTPKHHDPDMADVWIDHLIDRVESTRRQLKECAKDAPIRAQYEAAYLQAQHDLYRATKQRGWRRPPAPHPDPARVPDRLLPAPPARPAAAAARALPGVLLDGGVVRADAVQGVDGGTGAGTAVSRRGLRRGRTRSTGLLGWLRRLLGEA